MDYQKANDLQHAVWIRVPDQQWSAAGREPTTGIRTACFQIRFDLPTDRTGSEWPARISAASRYRCWLNGQPLGSGPCKGDRWRRFYDTIDLGPALVRGENILSVQVVAYSDNQMLRAEEQAPIWAQPSYPGPLLILETDDDRRSYLPDLSTGTADWQVTLHQGLSWHIFPRTQWAGAMEIMELAAAPQGWPGRIVNDALLSSAVIDSQNGYNPYGELQQGPLLPRPIPLLYERPGTFTTPIHLETYPHDTIWSVDLDAQRLRTAFFRLHLAGGKGCRIRILYSEGYEITDETGTSVKQIRDDAVHGDLIGVEDSLLCDGQTVVYEPFLFRTFRFVRITVEPGESALTRLYADFLETGYPLQPVSGIQSSEPWVQSVWQISQHTLQCCMHDTYEDCPYYEQLQYTLDTRLQMLFTYRLTGDTRMARRTLEDFHASRLPEGILQSRYPSQIRQIIPAFSLHWIFMLEDYYWQTADSDHIRRYMGTADSLIEWFRRHLDDHGLISHLGYWDFLDWAPQWDTSHGVPAAAESGPVTTHNLTLAVAARSLAYLHEVLDEKEPAAVLRQLADQLTQHVNEFCWNDQEGLFKDGPGCDQLSQHAQVWAVLADAVDPDRANTIMRQVLERTDLVPCSFPQQYFLFRALEKAGLYQQTAKQWTLWRTLLDLHLTTVPETPFTPRSDCHAWGALMLFEGPARLLGVEPAQPGWQRIRIQPRCDYLPDAAGRAATPHGPVDIRWRKTDDPGRPLELTAQCPAGIPVDVILPDDSVLTAENGGVIQIGMNAER